MFLANEQVEKCESLYSGIPKMHLSLWEHSKAKQECIQEEEKDDTSLCVTEILKELMDAECNRYGIALFLHTCLIHLFKVNIAVTVTSLWHSRSRC